MNECGAIYGKILGNTFSVSYKTRLKVNLAWDHELNTQHEQQGYQDYRDYQSYQGYQGDYYYNSKASQTIEVA